MKRFVIPPVLSLLLAMAPPGAQSAVQPQGTRLFVDAAAGPGGNGSSWSSAFGDLRQALVAAAERGAMEIWIAAGTYRPVPPGGSRSASFLVTSDVDVYGGFAGFETALEQRDPLANRTILSGDLNGDDQGFQNRGDNSLHVVRMVGSNLRLDGVTIRDGFADGGALGAGILAFKGHLTLAGVVLLSNLCEGSFARGGGLRAVETDLQVLDSTLQGNTVRPTALAAGGGMSLVDCDVRIRGGRFLRNLSTGSGGGFDTLRGTLLVDGVLLQDNEATDGGAFKAVFPEELLLRSSQFLGNEGTSGGAAFVENAPIPEPLRIEDCLFAENVGTAGGGMFLFYEDDLPVAYEVRRTVFESNVATTGGGLDFNNGSTRALLRDCAFLSNFTTSGGGITAWEDAFLDVARCAFVDNTAVAGGGMALLQGASATVERSTFVGNRLHPNAGLGIGGSGIYHEGFDLTIRSSTFHGNETEELWSLSPRARLFDSTVVHDAPGYAAVRGFGALKGTIVWGANPTLQGGWSAEYCDIQGGYPGTGNVDADPLFVDEAAGDLRLLAGSPCIDVGNPNALATGLDVGGVPRFLDGDLDGLLAVDIGAHEHALRALAVQAADGIVRVTTSGAVPDMALLVVGPEADPMFLAGAGYLFLQPVIAEPWPTAPGTVSLPIPPSLAGEAWVFQEVSTFGAARTVSNPVTVEL